MSGLGAGEGKDERIRGQRIKEGFFFVFFFKWKIIFSGKSPLFPQGSLVAPKGPGRKLQVTVSRPLEQASVDFLAL